jgi:plasmid stability protein
MAQFVVRNIADGVKSRLQRLARRNGRSMEEEVREILRVAVNGEDASGGGLATEISALFAKIGLDPDIPELRGHKIRPASFEDASSDD